MRHYARLLRATLTDGVAPIASAAVLGPFVDAVAAEGRGD